MRKPRLDEDRGAAMERSSMARHRWPDAQIEETAPAAAEAAERQSEATARTKVATAAESKEQLQQGLHFPRSSSVERSASQLRMHTFPPAGLQTVLLYCL